MALSWTMFLGMISTPKIDRPPVFFCLWQVAAWRLESSLIIGIELGIALARDL